MSPSTARTMAPSSMTSVGGCVRAPSPAPSTTWLRTAAASGWPGDAGRRRGVGSGSAAPRTGLGGRAARAAAPARAGGAGASGGGHRVRAQTGAGTGCGVGTRCAAPRLRRRRSRRPWLLRTNCLAAAGGADRCDARARACPRGSTRPAGSRCARSVAAERIPCRWPTAAAAARTPPRAAAAARWRRASRRARRAPPRRSGSASPEPSRAAWSRIRSSTSSGASTTPRAGGVGHRLQHDEVAEPLEQVGGEPARVVARVDHRFDGAEQRRRVAGGQRVDRVVDQREVGGAEQRQRPRVGDAGCRRRRRAAGRAPTACRAASRRRRGSPAGRRRRRRRRPPAAQIRSSRPRMVLGASSRNG